MHLEAITYRGDIAPRLLMQLDADTLPAGLGEANDVAVGTFLTFVELQEVMEAGAKKDGRKGKKRPNTGRRKDGSEMTNGGSRSRGKAFASMVRELQRKREGEEVN